MLLFLTYISNQNSCTCHFCFSQYSALFFYKIIIFSTHMLQKIAKLIHISKSQRTAQLRCYLAVSQSGRNWIILTWKMLNPKRNDRVKVLSRWGGVDTARIRLRDVTWRSQLSWGHKSIFSDKNPSSCDFWQRLLL